MRFMMLIVMMFALPASAGVKYEDCDRHLSKKERREKKYWYRGGQRWRTVAIGGHRMDGIFFGDDAKQFKEERRRSKNRAQRLCLVRNERRAEQAKRAKDRDIRKRQDEVKKLIKKVRELCAQLKREHSAPHDCRRIK